jgi:hypothetical protein
LNTEEADLQKELFEIENQYKNAKKKAEQPKSKKFSR